MFKNFDEVEQTLLKVLQDLTDITAEAKKNQEQEKQKGGCASCDDCLYGTEEEEIKRCSKCVHYDDCGCAKDDDAEEEEEDFKAQMNWLEECRRVLLDDFVDWMDALPYLPDEVVADINKNHVQIVKQLNKCFEQQIEPAIALVLLMKKSNNEEFGLADILKAFNLTVTKTSKETKNDEVSNKEKDLLNALKNSPLYKERKR